MSEPANAPGGSDQTDPGGNPGNQDPNKPNGDDGKVSYESFQKLLDEKKKLKERLDTLENDKRTRDEAALREKEQFKELADQYKSELEKTRGQLTEVNSRITNSRKISAVLKELDGEVDEKYWHLIDTDSIVYDDQTGAVDKMSVTKYAQKFKADYGEVIKRKNASDLPPTSPKGAIGSYISVDEYVQMSRDPSISKQKLWEARQRIRQQ